MNSPINPQRPVHFIGIGGIGMSALAMLLVDRGHFITGSDPRNNQSIKQLKGKGVTIFSEQKASNITEICNYSEILPLVVVSSAISEHNLELETAKNIGLEIWHRSDLLAALIKNQPSIAIAGSHGKTTTSTIVTTLLALSKHDPTAIIGGIVPFYGSNSHSGKGRLLIAEADESDGTLVKFQPELGVITNLELDHTDHYPSLNELIKTMQNFGRGCKRLLANKDCPIIKQNFNASAWWSINTKIGVDFAALPISLNGSETIADIYEKEQKIGQIILPMPGLHNLSNAIGAIAACRLAGLSFKELHKCISHLHCPARRFEFRGTWEGRHIVDDYAHHPSEIRETLSMARLMINTGHSLLPSPPQRLFVVFQPHRYTRTQQFLHEFAISLGEADQLVLAPVYGAGEEPNQQINSHTLANTIQKLHPKLKITIADNLDHLTRLVKLNSIKDDLVLAMGAGDINLLWDHLTHPNNPKQCATTLAA